MIREERLGPDLLRWTIDNPSRRNAIGPAALDWIAKRTTTLSGEIVELTGSGDAAFCAGFDLSQLSSTSEAPLPDASLIRASSAMVGADATFVAVARGHVIGAGVELACACDLRIAGDDVTFSVPAARLGVVYHAAGIARMVGALGAWNTTRLVLMGEAVPAADLAASGAGIRVVAANTARAEADRILATLRKTPTLVRGSHRELLRRLTNQTVDPAFLGRYEQMRAEAYSVLSVPSRGKPDHPSD